MRAYVEAATRMTDRDVGDRPRGDLRPVRGSLRARDAHPRARRADRRLGGSARVDPGFTAELEELGRTYTGRPSPITLSRRFAPGKRLYLKREDLNHTGAHKINNALGQVVLAQRLGKRRIIAETGAGQHGVATATACARFGLECVVYMGAEDMRRQAPNVERMHLMGATVEPVEFGTRTLKEATSAAIRDWITNVETTHYVIGSCVGPAPYPELVRELQAVIGREARAQLLEAEGRLPEIVVACVGGGSNAIGMFAGFLDDADVRLVGVEAADAASLGGGRTGVLHGSRSSILADEDGQIADAHSISAGLDYPGVGPEHAWLRDTGRATYLPCTDDEALDAFARLARTEGIIPALESSHALAVVEKLDAEYIAVCLSGRGDKDLAEALSALGEQSQGTRPMTPEEARHLPRLRAGDARAGPRGRRGRGGRDRAGLSLLRSAGRRPGDPARVRAGALTGNAHPELPRLPRRDPRRWSPKRRSIPMTYAALLEAYGWERFAADAGRTVRRPSSSPTSRPGSDRSSDASTSSRRPRPKSASSPPPRPPTGGSIS